MYFKKQAEATVYFSYVFKYFLKEEFTKTI